MKLRLKTDLRCAACVASIKPLLDGDTGIERWSADTTTPDKILTVEGDGLTAARIDGLIARKGYRVLGELPATPDDAPAVDAEAAKTTWYPLVLILGYLLGGTALLEYAGGGFDAMRAMSHFMAGFFLVFSFFKLLDVAAFAMSYSSYDIVASRFLAYGYVYPFIELGLGMAYLARIEPMLTNLLTLIVMGISTIGVVRALLARRKIQCACLGTVFNLPMSYVTLTEDLLMVAMAAAMLTM